LNDMHLIPRERLLLAGMVHDKRSWTWSIIQCTYYNMALLLAWTKLRERWQSVWNGGMVTLLDRDKMCTRADCRNMERGRSWHLQ
jgi:hypothetical protein